MQLLILQSWEPHRAWNREEFAEDTEQLAFVQTQSPLSLLTPGPQDPV